MSDLDVARASTDDISYIMATGVCGDEGPVGRFERNEHELALAGPSKAYFVGSITGKPVGFVIVKRWASEARRTQISA